MQGTSYPKQLLTIDLSEDLNDS